VIVKAYSTNGEKMDSNRLLIGKSEGKCSLRKPRRRWADNVDMNFGAMGWSGKDWTDLAYDKTNRGLCGEFPA
jgi:hypothetical protein